MKTMVAADRESVLAILAEEYGITNGWELAESMRKLTPMNLTPFCTKPETKEEEPQK